MFNRFIPAMIVLALSSAATALAEQEHVFANIQGPTLPSLFTTAADSIDYLNRGVAGWSLKPGSIMLVLNSDNGAQGIWTDDGNGTLSGNFAQVPGSQLLSATGVINYQTGAWAIFLADPFLGPALASYSYVVRKEKRSFIPNVFVYNDYLFTKRPGPTLQGLITTAADSIDYRNRGMAGWSLKPGSIMLVLNSYNGAQGIWTDDGFGGLTGRFNQAPGGALYSSSGVINYQTGAWAIFLSAPFLGPAQASYSFIVRRENRPFINNFDNTGRSHCTIYDRLSGRWYSQSHTGDVILWGTPFGGFSGAFPITGDYDGDGQADLGIYEPARGKWYVRDVAGNVILWGADWGFPGAVAVPGDYDGDGRSDLAVYDASRGKWYVRDIVDKVILWGAGWGYAGAVAVPGDYDGDGRSDLAVYDTARGKWYVRDVDGKVILWGADWGYTGAVAVPGDYDGDGRSDLAVYDATRGKWYIRDVTGKEILLGADWGFVKAVAVPGDYDGDGRSDLAVYDTYSGKWYVREVTGNVILWGINWGGFPGAYPVGSSL